jgi:hypothetical protein
VLAYSVAGARAAAPKIRFIKPPKKRAPKSARGKARKKPRKR